MLLTTHHPSGPASLVVEMDTGPYLGRIAKRIPFVIDNPAYGKPVPELPATAKLRAAHPGATVLEVYQGAALPALGIASYDGVRDVYFGDGRGDKSFGGSCTNRGTDLSYGTDLRDQLHLGGEGRRILIRYDLAMLPPGLTVRKALLMLHVEQAKSRAGLECQAIALKKRWSETHAGILGGLNPTNSPKPPSRGRLYPVGETENWEQPLYRGPSDRQSEPVAAVTFGTTGWCPVDITPAVRNWLSGEWANCGVAIEPIGHTVAYGKRDVLITASDYPVDPRLRPRLVLAIEGDLKPVRHTVGERNSDLAAALAKARAVGKPLLCHVLVAGSPTSRCFESRVLAAPEVRDYIAKHFVEARIDAAKPEHQRFLKAHGVRRFPAALILTPGGPEGKRVGILEPFDWDAPRGLLRSAFEFEQLYTQAIGRAAAKRRR